jgi:hypothetical protein
MQADTLTVGFHEIVSLGIPFHGAVSFEGTADLTDDCSIYKFLFGRPALEVLIVGLGIAACMVHYAVPMIGWSVQRIKLHGGFAGIDNVVMFPSRDHQSEACADSGSDSIQYGFPIPGFNAEKLVELVDFGPDVFARLQRHQDNLAVHRCIEHTAKVVIVEG